MPLDDEIKVRPAGPDDWQPAMDLAWRTFMKFDAADYCQKGVDNFREFVTDNTLYRNFCDGKYPVFVAQMGQETVGVISLRNGNHISLLFVDGIYHRRGIGNALISYVKDFLRDEVKVGNVTVFAAPYAYSFYKAVGFKEIGYETERDGMIFTPMELVFERNI